TRGDAAQTAVPDAPGVNGAAPAPVMSTLVRLTTASPGARPARRFTLSGAPSRLIGVALLVAFWELASLLGWIQPQDLAAPTAVVSTGAHMIANGALPSALWASLQRVFWGLAIGVPIGTALAIAAGLSRTGERLI